MSRRRLFECEVKNKVVVGAGWAIPAVDAPTAYAIKLRILNAYECGYEDKRSEILKTLGIDDDNQ